MPFGDAVQSEAALRELFPQPTHNSYRKQIDRLDEHCHELIGASPIVFVATASGDGRCDVSPRGGPPGWVRALDEHRLLLPEGRGNNRLDSLVNLLGNPGIGLLFVIPGRDETLRVNGRATITTDPELLASVPLRGRVPPAAIGVEAQEVFTHCGKAFIRSELWDPATWPEAGSLASPAEVLRAHTGAGTLEDAQARLDESYTQRLW
ncbi:MAG: phosphohydrolase [Solirubrobacterales bacterium]|nr:phosphohydrolase [Solirubrobacterales bacterium]